MQADFPHSVPENPGLGFGCPNRRYPTGAHAKEPCEKGRVLRPFLDLLQETEKVQLFLDVLLPWPVVATISTVWVPEESMPGW